MNAKDDINKEQALTEYRKTAEKRYKTGKLIITFIVTINVIISLLSFFSSVNKILVFIQLGLSLALYSGASWIKYLLAVINGFGALSMLYILLVKVHTNVSDLPVAYIVCVALISLIYCVSSCIILISSKSVEEFLYSQKNG